MHNFNESTIEQAALEWLHEIGYKTGLARTYARLDHERAKASDAVLWQSVTNALQRPNPDTTPREQTEALKRIQRAESQDLVLENYRYHNLMTQGVPVESKAPDGQPVTKLLRLIDFDNPAKNDWLALNQFTIIENGHNRRPDVLIFLNGLPVGLMELKTPPMHTQRCEAPGTNSKPIAQKSPPSLSQTWSP